VVKSGVRCAARFQAGLGPLWVISPVFTRRVRSMGVRSASIATIGGDAVGTPITERPPHRTVQAAFPHTAPTLGV